MTTTRATFLAALCGILLNLNLSGCGLFPFGHEDEPISTTPADDDDVVADDDDDDTTLTDDDDTLPADDDDITPPADDDDSAVGDDDTLPTDDDDTLPTDDDDTVDSNEGDTSGECDDGSDNDGDGMIDCDDPGCVADPVCIVSDDDDVVADDDDTLPADDDDTTPPEPIDNDGDGYSEGVDCDDSDSTVHPGATELCDGLDTNCNGAVPSNEVDVDADGWMICDGDCNDATATVHPGATELCDGLDTNCNGAVPSNEVDVDADGWMICDGDCNDATATVHPGANELCDGLDTNCNGNLPSAEVDNDADGWMICDGDCNDATATVHPGATELCGDGIDNDCDGNVDVGCPPSWCPTGTVIELTGNGGFETVETFEYDPQPGNGWGYELNVPPVQTCSAPSSAHGGSCFVTLLSNSSTAYYMEQLQFLVSPASVGLDTGDAIHVSVAARTVGGGGQTLALQILNDATYGSAVSFGSWPVQAPSAGWQVSETTTTYTSSVGVMRIAVHFGGLAQNVRLDDFVVQACLNP
jgi:hypothetical protein